jgi:hypothetical protein
MRTVEELIDINEPGWKIVSEWINTAKNKVEILKADSSKAIDALYKTQVSTRSPMGSIIYNTGGILIDNGWIRILGSGNQKLNRTLPDWNKGKSFNEYGEQSKFLLIADDVIGGFFILNGGEFGADLGKIYYLSPDSLEYEPLGINYSEFLQFCFNTNLEDFYQNKRWKDWENEVSILDGNKMFSFYPYLWSKEAKAIKDINKIKRKEIPVEEQYFFNLELRERL